ncbi:transient receptor potential cation channel subfamily A member 1-like isoform X2 [Schistocerca gregaria]|uniref:transient receptor potential cation channel subfamily A member 1-like isoform X2 n=1 Tax=Schistocerca gregaria TaxID=7010 RepID=UPI00211E43F4|nr:transient receptor potential cation channel subfamily A member 1-like isoform X2 [Schistocerca gregaria]
MAGENIQHAEDEAQAALLQALLDNDYEAFSRLLDGGRVEPSHRYGKPHFATCLEIACRRPTLPTAFVNKLLECGVKPNVNVIVPEPIHYAARAAHRELDVDRRLVGGRTARQALEAQLPDVAAKMAAAGVHVPAGKRRLLLAMDQGDFPLYQRLLRRAATEVDFDPDFWFEQPYNTRLLERACGHRDSELAAKFVKVTLDAGAKSSAVNLCNQRRPLHVAAASGNSAALKLLLECAPGDVNAKDTNDQTALHLAASCSSSTHSHECLQLLLNVENVDVNLKDSSGHTPADVAGCLVALSMIQRKGGTKSGPNTSIGHGANGRMKLLSNGHSGAPVTHGDVIIPISIASGFDPATDEPTNGPSLFRGFRSDGGSAVDGSDFPNGNFAGGGFSTGRFSGGALGRALFIGEGLDRNGRADSGNGSSSSDSYKDNRSFVSDWTDGAEEDTHVQPRNVCLRKKLFHLMVRGQYANFEQEFDKLSSSDALMDCADCGYTFLQYACERGLHDFAKKLLEKVNPNATHERNRRTPLMLSCLQNDKKMVYILLNTESTVKIDVNAVDHKRNTALHFAAKNDTEIIVELLSRGADLLAKNTFGKYPLSVQEFRSLLDHGLSVRDNILPSNDDYAIKFNFKMLISQKNVIKRKVVESKCFPVQDHASYLDVTSDHSELMEPPLENTYKEMDILHSLTNLPDYRLLLKHPLITSYLQVKNDHMRFLQHLNLILYLVFVITLNVYILMQVSDLDRTSAAVQSIEIFCCVTAVICTVFMLVTEVAQLVLKTSLYFQNCENVYDISLITFAILILSQCPLGSFSRWVYTASILLSWRGLFVITSRHYKFSTNVEMLRAVSVNYLHLLKSYIFIIVAFSLSFYVIFSPPTNETVSAKSLNEGNSTLRGTDVVKNTGEDSESGDFFQNPFRTFLKTLIMMTGEFDANDLPFETDIWLTSIVFILFLFYLPVVLLNLLTALAVSDEQQIRGDAEILSIMSQIHCLYEIENITVCLNKLCRRWKYAARKFENLLLFSGKSEEACLVVWPNKGGQTRISGEQGKHLKSLDPEIMSEAKRILSERESSLADSSSEVSNLSLLLERIERVESSVKLLIEGQQQKDET